jgi:hypothetical protein
MKTGTKEYYAEYYQKNKEKHNNRVKKYKINNEKIQLYELEYQKQKYYKQKAEGNLDELKQKWRDQALKRNKLRRDFISEYKSQCSCKKCGENRTYVLDFHHINPNEKEFDLGEATKYSITKLIAELEKCITLCRNCHSEFHFFEKEQGTTINDYLQNVAEQALKRG